MRSFTVILLSLIGFALPAQSPPGASLPEPIAHLSRELVLDHFPSVVYACRDEGVDPERYFWKHNTAVLSPVRHVTVVECGAYIYYHEQWNERATFNQKAFAKMFDCPKGRLVAGQPYTFAQNWRQDSRLLGGWAMWYVIAETESGERIMGYSMLETVGEMIDGKNRLDE